MKVKLDDIEIYAGTQARQGIDQDTVDKYAERMIEGDQFPPIVLFNDGSGYYIGDGHHRVLGSIKNEFVDIEAEVKIGTKNDALWYAMGANRINGKSMTRGDLRHAVTLALKTWPDKTQQAIADQVGCSQWLVSKTREDIIGNNNISLPETRTDTMGRTRPTTYKKQEPQAEPETEETQEETGEHEKQKMETSVEKPKRLKHKPPCMGMQFANLAIMDLEKIEDNDTEKDEALTKVENWINEHRA